MLERASPSSTFPPVNLHSSRLSSFADHPTHSEVYRSCPADCSVKVWLVQLAARPIVCESGREFRRIIVLISGHQAIQIVHEILEGIPLWSVSPRHESWACCSPISAGNIDSLPARGQDGAMSLIPLSTVSHDRSLMNAWDINSSRAAPGRP